MRTGTEQNEQQAQEYATGALPFELTPKGQAAEFQRQTLLEEAAIHQKMQAMGWTRAGNPIQINDPTGKKKWVQPWTNKAGQEQYTDMPAGYEPSQTGYIRMGQYPVTPEDALNLLNVPGITFPKLGGGEWAPQEIQTLPKGIVLQPTLQGNQISWVPVDQRLETRTLGNVVTQLPQFGQASGRGAPLGVARTPTVTAQATPGGGMVTTQVATPQTSGAF